MTIIVNNDTQTLNLTLEVKQGPAGASTMAAQEAALAAQESRTQAAASATSALNSANSANLSAQGAQSSQVIAQESEAAALNFAGQAESAAGLAELSATDAAMSAMNALTSETSAGNFASQAQTSATNALASANAADISEANALTSASNAAMSASSALTSASNAAMSASSALTSASNASISEANASLSANQAAVSAQEAMMSAETAVNAPGTSATSTTTNTIDLNSPKTFIIQPNKEFAVGQFVVVAYRLNVANNLIAQIASHNKTTGELVLNILDANGSGTFSDWSIALAAISNTDVVIQNTTANLNYRIVLTDENGNIFYRGVNAVPFTYNPNTGLVKTVTFEGSLIGNASSASKVATVSRDDNITYPLLFGSSATNGNIDVYYDPTTGTYNPSNNTAAINISGNSNTATRLATTRTIALSGDVTGSASFDGSANITITAVIQPNSVALGTDTTGDYVATASVSGNGLTGSATGEGSSFTVTSNATALETPNTLVFRDASGNFEANIITADLNGTATTATSAGTATTATNVSGGSANVTTITASGTATLNGDVLLGNAGTDITTVNSQLSANGTVGTAGQILASRGDNLSPQWIDAPTGGGTGAVDNGFANTFLLMGA